MNLHENRGSFRDAIRAASDHHGIPDDFVEKDYWVTYILKRLAHSKNFDKVVFKGGTSLSKAYKLINRFSEDIDLAILQSDSLSKNQIGKLIRSIQKELTDGFTEVHLKGVTSQYKNFRKTAYEYDRIVDPNPNSGINEELILEINSLADPVPFEKIYLDSLIAQFLRGVDNKKAIEQYNLQSFELNVLVPNSTLIEKVLSLIRLSFFKDSISRIKSKVRHFYDIYFLSKSNFCKEYITTEKFKEDFARMYKEDKTKFNDPESWQKSTYQESPIFKSFDEIWGKVKDTYETDFKLLVYGEFPGEKKISDKFREIIEILK